ncbi:MAG TPA: MBL fold metallo-hydrolase [Thermodesulfobacteriota bacterium]|nr:MBL fold metallo-hydrolase [Thermodesulfobacteriota bacterium]
MKIYYYAHSAFKITTEAGVQIIIDPYEPGGYDGALGYGKITDKADIVITSHDHADHNYTKDIKGEYTLINKAGDNSIKGVKIKTIPVFHDPSQGKERGNNRISVISADGLTLAHLGDLGHDLEGSTLKEIGKVDLLLLPVGGFFTIDAGEAKKITNALAAPITIPMHFKTEKVAFPIANVENFTKGFNQVKILKGSELEIKKENLPKNPEVIVLKHAL